MVSGFTFYNIYFSQLSYFVSYQTDERFREYFTAFRSVFTTNFSASLRSQLWNELFDREVSAFIFYNIYFATHGVHILLLTAQMKGFMSTFRPLVQPVLSVRRICTVF